MRGVTKFDKVVKREICSIQTQGTRRCSFIDGDTTTASNTYLMAICEKVYQLEMYFDTLCTTLFCSFLFCHILNVVKVCFKL